MLMPVVLLMLMPVVLFRIFREPYAEKDLHVAHDTIRSVADVRILIVQHKSIQRGCSVGGWVSAGRAS